MPSLSQPIRPPAPAPASPPFGLVAPVFPFPALARLAGVAQLGETRETVLATLLGARLAIATMPPYRLSVEQREERARSALAWLAVINLPEPVRPAIRTLFAATGEGHWERIAAALDDLAAHAADALDDDSIAELRQLSGSLINCYAPPSEQIEDPSAAGSE